MWDADRRIVLRDAQGIPQFQQDFYIGWDGFLETSKDERSINVTLGRHIHDVNRGHGYFDAVALSEDGKIPANEFMTSESI